MRIIRLSLLLTLSAAGVGAATLDRNTGDGVYTAAQADEGAVIFEQVCMECHLPGWHDTTGFYAKWQGKPLRALGTYLKNEMPQTDPGVLTANEYAAVTAYLLRLTGNPPGAEPLSSDLDALATIRLDTARSSVRR